MVVGAAANPEPRTSSAPVQRPLDRIITRVAAIAIAAGYIIGTGLYRRRSAMDQVDLTGDGLPNDAPHTSSVYALRDTEVIGISRKGWERMVRAEPELLEAMIRIILTRLGRADDRSPSAAPTVPSHDEAPRVSAMHVLGRVLGRA